MVIHVMVKLLFHAKLATLALQRDRLFVHQVVGTTLFHCEMNAIPVIEILTAIMV